MVAMAIRKTISLAAQLARRRVWVQALFLLVWLDPFLLRLHGVCGPVFHCYSCPLALVACPIGVLANFSAIHVFPFLAVGTLLLVGTLVGSFVCGWSCPLGLLQDLIARVPTRKFEPPAWAGHLRYVVLAGLVLAIPYFFGEEHPLFICRLCPAGAIEAAMPNTVSTALAGGPIAWPSAAKNAILVAFLASSLFVRRPWCTMFCPLGAIFGLFNGVSVFFLRFHPDRCTDCHGCRKHCHYGGYREGLASELQCIRCLDCTRCDALTVDHIFTKRG